MDDTSPNHLTTGFTGLPFSSRCRDPGKGTARLRAVTYTCEVCSASFNKRSKLVSHTYRHGDARPHQCATCVKAFQTAAYLQRHLEVHAEPTETFGCSLCDFRARSKSYLKTHFLRRHTADFRFTCERCGKMFKVQGDYTTHLKDHEAHACVCDVCGRLYPTKSSLYFHKHYKHSTKTKNFECDVCRKRFRSQKNLTSHVALHRARYKCEHCAAEFGAKYGLTKHLPSYTEKNYVCGACGKRFSSLSSQNVHLLSHAGERPYVCDVCGKSFTQRSPMILHRRKHPGELPAMPPVKIAGLLGSMKASVIRRTTSS